MTTSEVIKSQLAEQADREESPTIYDALDLHGKQLEAKIPSGTLTYGYARAALMTELRRVPKLRETDPGSVLAAFAYGLQLGLVPGPLGHFYIVPFKRTGKLEATPIIGYKGYADLAFRSGKLKSLEAFVVREGDAPHPWLEKGYRYGSRPFLDFAPNPPAEGPDERPWIAVYALAQLTNGGKPFVVLTPAQVAARKAKSAGSSHPDSPWQTFTETMWRKCPVRELAQRGQLPLSAGDVAAIERDDGEPFDLEADAIEVENSQPKEPA